MSIVYVGLDLGSSNFQQVALNHDGVSRVNRDFTTSEANLVKAFSDLKGEIHVHLEAGELAPWAASIIAPLVTRVVCSHPQSNAWIAKDADKCDRVDAYKLAELLRLNRFKEVHYAPDQRRRNFKQLVQHYDELTAQQARLKTKLKARLRMQGVIVTGERLFSAQGRKEVLAKVESRDLRTAITQLYSVLDQAVAAYRSRFRPSFVLDEPYFMPAVSVLCAPTEEEARWLSGPSALSTLQLRTGRLGPVPSPEEAAAYRYSPQERAVIDATMATHLIGEPDLVHQGLVELQHRTGADEIMLSTRAHSLEARLQSLTLVASVWTEGDLAGTAAPAV